MLTLRMTKMCTVKRVAEGVDPYEIKGRAVGEGLAPICGNLRDSTNYGRLPPGGSCLHGD